MARPRCFYVARPGSLAVAFSPDGLVSRRRRFLSSHPLTRSSSDECRLDCYGHLSIQASQGLSLIDFWFQILCVEIFLSPLCSLSSLPFMLLSHATFCSQSLGAILYLHSSTPQNKWLSCLVAAKSLSRAAGRRRRQESKCIHFLALWPTGRSRSPPEPPWQGRGKKRNVWRLLESFVALWACLWDRSSLFSTLLALESSACLARRIFTWAPPCNRGILAHCWRACGSRSSFSVRCPPFLRPCGPSLALWVCPRIMLSATTAVSARTAARCRQRNAPLAKASRPAFVLEFSFLNRCRVQTRMTHPLTCPPGDCPAAAGLSDAPTAPHTRRHRPSMRNRLCIFIRIFF